MSQGVFRAVGNVLEGSGSLLPTLLVLFCLAPRILVADAHADAAPPTQAQTRFFASGTERSVRPSFFQKGSARTVFSDSAARESQASIEFFPKKIVKQSEEESQAQGMPASLQSNDTQPAVKEAGQELAHEPKTPEERRQKLLEEFGDPSKEAPVQAQETAPKPFRGMMAALEAGDENMARSYARQYVRYVGRFESRTNRAVELMGSAMEREGMMERGAWPASPAMQRDREAYAAESSLSEGSARELDQRATALLREIESASAEEGGKRPEAVERPAPIDDDPMSARRSLAGKVPVDSGSKVQILFFFKPFDTSGQRMAKELQSVYQAALKLGGRSVVGMALSPMTAAQEKHFRERTGITFPIDPDGSTFASLLEIKSTPTTAIMSPRLEKAFLVEGTRGARYMLEIVHMMEGR